MKPDRFTEMGIASLLPGMQYMIDEMQERLTHLKQTLLAFREHREEGLRRVAREINQEFGFEPKRRGRPPGSKNGAGRYAKKAGSWANMSKAERSVEMKRRQMVAQLNRGGPRMQKPTKMHPRDPNHPGHAEWLQKISKANRKHWASLSASARKKQIKNMVARRVNGAAVEAPA